jgi:hypothetical protein
MLNAVRALSGGGSARLFVRSRPEPSQVGVGHGPAESAAHTMRTVKPAALFINDCLHTSADCSIPSLHRVSDQAL